MGSIYVAIKAGSSCPARGSIVSVDFASCLRKFIVEPDRALADNFSSPNVVGETQTAGLNSAVPDAGSLDRGGVF
ncbi:hypothetical protein [Bradyrhizobium sp. USDA 4486]